MAWRESPGVPGTFKRPLSVSEKGMVAAVEAFRPSPRELIRINAFVDFTVSHRSRLKVISAFRTAWKAFRLLKSPDIATTFEDGCDKVYHVPSPSELDAWVERTFIVSGEPDTTVQSAVREMQQRIELLPVCQLISHSTRGSSSSLEADDDDDDDRGMFRGTLILYVSHWRTEAAGAFKILDNIFSFAADLLTTETTTTTTTTTTTRKTSSIAARLSSYRPGDEVSLLTPAMEDILMPDSTTTTPQSKGRVAAHFEKYFSSLPCVDFPMSHHHGGESTPFGPVKEIRHVYSVDATETLHASCKSHGISVTAAIHSAHIGAVYSASSSSNSLHLREERGQNGDRAIRDRKRNYACLMPAQVRTRLPRSSPYRDQGCWSSAQMLMLVVPPGQDFITRALGLKGQYNLANDKEWMYQDSKETSEQVSMLGSRTPPDQPVSLAYFTGLGVIDGETIKSEYQCGGGGGDDDDDDDDEVEKSQIKIKISDLDFFADPLSPGIVLRAWTFESKLNIHVVWNGSYHDDLQMREFMKNIEETLTEELGVDMSNERVVVEEKEF